MKKTGFSLVELSIVIIIIGLLIVAATSGKGIIEQARLKGVVAEIQAIKKANTAFILTHDAFPGDFADAETIWGIYNVSTNPKGAINGDGNNDLYDATNAWRGEVLGVWHHLELAGLMDDEFSRALINQGAATLVPGTDVPISVKFPALAYHYIDSVAGDSLDDITLYLGTQTSGDRPVNPAFTVKQAHFIDKKIDDGAASTGNVTKAYSYAPGWGDHCDTNSDDEYDLTDTGKKCNLGIINTMIK